MIVEFHQDAHLEFIESIDYYEKCEKGLGEKFSVEVFSAIQKIKLYPNAWPILSEPFRRCLTNRFPYGIIYTIETDRILILAIMHLHRNPNYWAKRV